MEATSSPSALLARATDANALLTADTLRTLPPVLADRVRTGSLVVVSARYDLDIGASPAEEPVGVSRSAPGSLGRDERGVSPDVRHHHRGEGYIWIGIDDLIG